MSNTQDYTSEGFDLDNIPSDPNAEDVVLELGGEVSVLAPPPSASASASVSKSTEAAAAAAAVEAEENILIESEEWKAKGNEAFKAKDYMGAYEYYSNAMDACPGDFNGDQLMQMKEEFESKEREKANERHRKEQEKRLRISRTKNQATAPSKDNENNNNDDDDDAMDESSLQPASFEAPKHPHAKNLSIYHSNRAASLFHLTRYSECITDCTIAILLNPNYVKPFLRRSAAYEKTDQLTDALDDAKTALKLEPSNLKMKKDITRLEKMEAERLEKLKEETMGKLKDLGNSILGNFGLSLDNFQAQKDPNTGSYSISFNN